MPGATPTYGLPYPILGEQPHGPNQIEALAQALDTLLNGSYKTDRDTAIAAAIAALLTGKASDGSVATLQTTTSSSYADLTTAGPQATVVSAGTRALLIWSAQTWNSNSTFGTTMAVAITGATTRAAQDVEALKVTIGSSGEAFQVAQFAYVPIAAGSNTYTCKYKAPGGGTGNWANRRLFVFAP